MANRKRPIQILFCVSDDEKRIIKAKMAQLGTKNMGAYLRKIDVYKRQQLHRNLAKGSAIQEFMLYDMTTKPEYEANIVAAEILFDTEMCIRDRLVDVTVLHDQLHSAALMDFDQFNRLVY